MPTTDLTAEEMQGSLNGFDDIAVGKHFGRKPYTMATALNNQTGDADPVEYARALAFVFKRREGMKDQEAYDAAMALTFTEAMDFFATPVDEPMPSEPQSESGKDSSPRPEKPKNSQPSAS